MVKISFYRRLQKELSTDIGIVSGNILGENFILEYNLDGLATKRITPKQIYVKTCLGKFCIFRFCDDTSLLELKKSFIQGSKNCPYANDLKHLVKNLDNIKFT